MELEREDGWEREVARCLSSRGTTLHLIGVGNPIGRDDSVGVYMVSALRKRFGARPAADVWIHRATLSPERVLSRLGGEDNALVFDAVDCNRAPGSRFCARLVESKVGFFVTHNVPLKLIPGVESALERVWVLGIQPEDTGIGEGLSAVVRGSADVLVGHVGRLLEEKRIGRS